MQVLAGAIAILQVQEQVKASFCWRWWVIANENALAVGYGRNSDNNKISIKVGEVSIPAVM